MIFSTNASITANEKSREPCCFLNFLNWLSLLWVCCVKTPVNQSKGSPVTHSLLLRLNLLAPSGALVVIMVYYIHTYIHVRTDIQPSFSIFSNSSDSKVKVKVKVKGPNMCYIFEKHGIQGYRIWHSRVSNVKYTNNRLHKYANTQIQSA